MLPSPNSTAPGPTPKRLKRPRALQACNRCRAKKYKCDGTCPCHHCRRLHVECVFRSSETAAAANTYPASYVEDLEARLQVAEAAARRSESLPGNRYTGPSPSVTHAADTEEPIHQVDSCPNGQILYNQSRISAGHAVHGHAILSDRLHSLRKESDEELTDEGGTEVVDVNPLTRVVEFHGNTSSVAFLGRLRKEYLDVHDDPHQRDDTDRPSLVGTFHNHQFSPQSTGLALNEVNGEHFYSSQAYVFLEAYFNTLHYIHPILDRGTFFKRCEDLWQDHPERQSSGFIALYLSLLSLGALIRTWTKEKINGMDRFEWSRMLFERAHRALGKPGFNNDLDTIQTLFIMAKICQNELNPNLAYMYLGMAIRASLSAGINRNTPIRNERQANGTDALSISKTWWGLYSLEIELSFALGRPDTLGMDEYHNRPMPPIDDSEVAIVSSMINLARIIRTISVSIYLARLTLAEKLTRAFRIEADMDAWVARLPKMIRPSMTPDVHQNGSLRDAVWAPVQRLVLQIRYYNVKMLLLRPFIIHAAKISPPRTMSSLLNEAVSKCVNAAVGTIETIYETCRVHTFFRTWWYNTTYITFAASILLFRAAQPTNVTGDDTDYNPVIEKSLELLDSMNESVVASKTADVLRQMITRLRERQRRNSTRDGNQMPLEAQAQNPSAGASTPQDIDLFIPLEGMDIFSLGSGLWEGEMWNWGHDLEVGWD